MEKREKRKAVAAVKKGTRIGWEAACTMIEEGADDEGFCCPEGEKNIEG